MNKKCEAGLMFDIGNTKLVKKIGKKGERIPKHNHPEANVFFILSTGKVRILLDEVNEFHLRSGEVLHFDGESFIQAEFLEDGEAVVVLAAKDMSKD